MFGRVVSPWYAAKDVGRTSRDPKKEPLRRGRKRNASGPIWGRTVLSEKKRGGGGEEGVTGKGKRIWGALPYSEATDQITAHGERLCNYQFLLPS